MDYLKIWGIFPWPSEQVTLTRKAEEGYKAIKKSCEQDTCDACTMQPTEDALLMRGNRTVINLYPIKWTKLKYNFYKFTYVT